MSKRLSSSRSISSRAAAGFCLLTLVLSGAPVSGAEPFCPLTFRNLVMKELGGAELLINADKNLKAVKDVPGLKVAFRRLRQDEVALLEQGVDAEQSIETLLRAVVNPNVTKEEMAKALTKSEFLRGGFGQGADERFIGVLQSNGTPFSTNWMINLPAGNRGHYFEAAAAYNAMTDGIRFLPGYGSGTLVVNKSDVLGMGFTALTTAGERVQGDLVTKIPTGVRYFDWKAQYPPGLEYDLDQLRRVKDALMDRKVEDVIFAIEDGSVPSQTWLNAVTAYNAELVTQGRNPIRIGFVGTF